MGSIIKGVVEATKQNLSRGSSRIGELSDKARDVAAFRDVFGGMFRANIKSQVMEKNKILPAVSDRAAVGAYKMLRTRVLQRMRSNNWQSLIVTGAGPGEGKTLTACNLAVSISNDVNQSVILVDLDLQRSCLASYFGLSVKASIGDYLTGNASIEDIVYIPKGMERIAIIPNRDAVPNSSELLASPRMRELVRWVSDRDRASVAIFDMPPVLACDDVLAFSPSVDAILMVVAEGLTERLALSGAMEMLEDSNVLGIALNRSRALNPVSPYY